MEYIELGDIMAIVTWNRRRLVRKKCSFFFRDPGYSDSSDSKRNEEWYLLKETYTGIGHPMPCRALEMRASDMGIDHLGSRHGRP